MVVYGLHTHACARFRDKFTVARGLKLCLWKLGPVVCVCKESLAKMKNIYSVSIRIYSTFLSPCDDSTRPPPPPPRQMDGGKFAPSKGKVCCMIKYDFMLVLCCFWYFPCR